MSTLSSSANEHQAIRYGNEWQCARCGKAWHVKDEDIPPCVDVTTIEYKTDRLNGIREELNINQEEETK